MKKLIFIVFILLIVSNLFAVRFNFNDFKDKEFQRHFLFGAGTTAVGWHITGLFCKKTIVEEGFLENGDYYYRKRTIENLNAFPIKMITGIALTCAVANLTHQEPEPDAQAMMVGCISYIQFQFLLDIIRRVR